MNFTAAILSGGRSKRLDQITKDKGLLEILGKPMIQYIIEECRKIASEIIIVVSNENFSVYNEIFSNIVDRIVIDNSENIKSPLIGAKAAFEHASNQYTFLLPCDIPLLKKEVLSFLSKQEGYDAIIPRWPRKKYIEPLLAVYRTEIALNKTIKALKEKKLDMKSMICQLPKVLYVSINDLKIVDPNMDFLQNVNTENDLKKVTKRLLQHPFSKNVLPKEIFFSRAD